MIEVIHCHIPKTGGVSFLQIIEEIYGKEAIAFPWTWLGLTPEEGRGFQLMWYEWPKLKRLWVQNIPRIVNTNDKLRLLQGHHPVGLYSGMFPAAKRICWMRHPVARVVSNYHHDMKKGHQPKMEIEEYIDLPHNRNVQSFMMGHNVDNFDFVGILEDYDKDMERLAVLLNWKYIPEIPKLNVGAYAAKWHKHLGKKIAGLNEKDMYLFAEAAARKESVWTG